MGSVATACVYPSRAGSLQAASVGQVVLQLQGPRVEEVSPAYAVHKHVLMNVEELKCGHLSNQLSIDRFRACQLKS